MPQDDRRLNRPTVEPGEPIWWDRGYHPHMESQDHIQHVCFHLADSLPRHAVEAMAADIKAIPPMLRDPEKEKRVNAYLDAGYGSCVLREPLIAEMVQQALLHFSGKRYTLHEWCVMPNHVHVLFHPTNGWTMSSSVASWKSFIGRRISAWMNQHAGYAGLRPGPQRVWHREYFDRYIRDEAHYANVVAYIHNNPVQAGLCERPEDWASSSAGYHR